MLAEKSATVLVMKIRTLSSKPWHFRASFTLFVVAVSLVATSCSHTATNSSSSGSTNTNNNEKINPAKYEVNHNPLIIRTVNGPVRGMESGNVRQFLGIPYAQPPVGNLRFRAPQPVQSWSTTLNATSPPSQCPQILPVVNIIVGSENCLDVNVFSPSHVTKSPKAVMVWFYGGGFTVGGSMDDNPTTIVSKKGIVAVTFNYRLGPFGFLALPQLAAIDPYKSSGDQGLEDQLAALKWVHANIARFGGNPNNVTIFGESAGGMSVCAQLATPLSNGLFEKAITESGPCNLPAPSLAQAQAQGLRYLHALGCNVASDYLACLDAKPVDQLLKTMPPDPTFVFNRSVNWFPTADGHFLPSNTLKAFEEGNYKHIPIIVGANKNEGTLFVYLAYDAQGRALAPSQWAEELNAYFGPTLGAQVAKTYPLSKYPNPEFAFGQALGDAILACPAVESAAGASKYQPVYEYEFSNQSNPFVLAKPNDYLGAFHSSELPYVFGSSVESSGAITFSAQQSQLSNDMMNAWVHFAQTGNPSTASLHWPRLTKYGGAFMNFLTPKPIVSKAMKSADCAFWKTSKWTVADVGNYGLASPGPTNSVPLGFLGADGLAVP